jgi:hypothetical protein
VRGALVISAVVALAACSGGTRLQVDASADGSPPGTVASDAAAIVDIAVDFAVDVAVAIPVDAPVTDAEIVDAPVDGSELADTGTVVCTGSFSGVTLKQLQAAISAAMGACAARGDVYQVCTANLSTVAGLCGLRCLGMNDQQSCIQACIRTEDPQLGEGCAACYAAAVACAQQNCLPECAANPAAPRCTQCQVDKGCRSAFRTCSGLP